MKRIKNGFSLIELMIVIAVVTTLVTLSYPSYASFIRKANRAQAQAALLDWANRQEIWRADHPSYNPDINPGNTEFYTYSMVSTATSYTLTATAIGNQANDVEKGVSCVTMTLLQDGSTGPAGHQHRWGEELATKRLYLVTGGADPVVGAITVTASSESGGSNRRRHSWRQGYSQFHGGGCGHRQQGRKSHQV